MSTKLLVQNAKMLKTSKKHKIDLYNFGIPAYRSETGLITCPQALHCIAGCYARSGMYAFGNVKNAYEYRLDVTLSPQFIVLMSQEIESKLELAQKHGHKLVIRVHDSGDFYSKIYALNWIRLMVLYPQVHFYAYTKQVLMFQSLTLPSNFRVIYSMGGKQDSSIKNARHARVFENKKELKRFGFTDGTNDDMVAAKGKSKKIGLVFHGAKKYSNTGWSNVKKGS